MVLDVQLAAIGRKGHQGTVSTLCATAPSPHELAKVTNAPATLLEHGVVHIVVQIGILGTDTDLKLQDVQVACPGGKRDFGKDIQAKSAAVMTGLALKASITCSKGKFTSCSSLLVFQAIPYTLGRDVANPHKRGSTLAAKHSHVGPKNLCT